jgi:phosphoglycolate phosphatase-like HAD superfamily hydrolase
VFDIDGTLTDTMDVDVECYEVAAREVLGIGIPADWASFDEVTDSAILATACARVGRRPPDPASEARVAERVGELLQEAFRRSPERFSPIPGARTVFQALAAAGWRVAMATGAWRPSALVKLEAAGIPTAGVPLATSTDRAARSDIIRHAVASVHGAATDAVVYVGDGVWDGRAAAALGFGFVGIGPVDKVDALGGVGAVGVVRDFSDPSRLMTYLERARP